MSTLTASPEYTALLAKIPPKVIRTEKENEAYTEILYDLDRRSKTLTPAEKELAQLLTLLIEDFEEKRYRLPRAKPLEVLHILMDQHGLRQKDLQEESAEIPPCNLELAVPAEGQGIGIVATTCCW